MRPENYKYHLAIRLRGYNYAYSGIYFITICATNRCDFFGRVECERSILNDFGLIAEACWKEIPEHFERASLMDYIIMPDHVHGLIRLNEKNDDLNKKEKGTARRASTGEINKGESFGKPTKGSIPTIVRSYKSAVTNAFNRKFPKIATFVWQPGYYEHINRDQEELDYTIDYIKSNPAEWEADRK